MSALGAAVIGTGFIGPVHVEGLRRAGVSVVGILGSTPEKSQAAADSQQIPRAYRSLDELLADPHVHAVHITSPNRHHFEQAQRCLAAGKHVLCEKPLAMNSQESAELVRLAASSGVVAGVNYNIRYYPLCREVAERVRNGSMGDIYHVTGSYVQDWLFHPTDYNWRVLSSEGGDLRAVADIGTHWLDLIQFMSGLKIVSVCADLQTVHPQRAKPTGGSETFTSKLTEAGSASGDSVRQSPAETVAIDTEDAGTVMLKFNNGARGVMHVSQVSAGRKNCLRFEMAGSKQAVAWNSESSEKLWIGHRDRPNETLIRDPGLLTDAARRVTSYPGGHNEGFADTFKQCFREFYGYIATGDFSQPPPFPTFADGHREIRLCEAILASHRQRAWEDVVAD